MDWTFILVNSWTKKIYWHLALGGTTPHLLSRNPSRWRDSEKSPLPSPGDCDSQSYQKFKVTFHVRLWLAIFVRDENTCGKSLMFPHRVEVRALDPPASGSYLYSLRAPQRPFTFSLSRSILEWLYSEQKNCHSTTSPYLPEIVSYSATAWKTPHQNVSRTEAHPQCSRV